MKCGKLTFEECELAILRTIVDKAEKVQGKEMVNTPEIKKMLTVIEDFLAKEKCIVYGGTAINNILPKEDQFYDYEYELPDYDFYSPTAMDLAIKLADIYVKKGFTNVEAKAGVHHGTYKVFVNNLGIADITYLHPDLFNAIQKDAIVKNNILYSPINFLRQAMYLELSRPKGDVSRWEKVVKRLNVLNKHFPVKAHKCQLQRGMNSKKNEGKLFDVVQKYFVDNKNIFIGGYANALYTKYSTHPNIKAVPDFDVLSEDPHKSCTELKDLLESNGFTKVVINQYEPIGELISEHYSVSIDGEYIAFVYQPVACHSYNIIKIRNREIRVGTIDTLLSFYLAFLYANRHYHNANRLLCMSKYLFEIQQENRLRQKGLLQRFSTECYGVQPTLNSIREEKMQMFKTLNPKSKKYKEYFLKYIPKTRKKKT
jgi:hypothetical protein